MEISPRRSLSLDFDASIVSPAASSYPPTYLDYRTNVYPTPGMKPVTDSEVTKPFAITSSMSMDSGAQNMLVPKKENFISNILNVVTNAVIERFGKVPSSFMNNINSTLSVTVVPNEGIISQDFFKTLTRSSEQLASEHQNENKKETIRILEISEISPNNSIYDSKSQMSYVFANNARIEKLPTKVSLNCQQITETGEKSTENEFNCKFTSTGLQQNNDTVCHIKDLTMKGLTTELVPVDEGKSLSLDCNETHTHIKSPCSSRSGQPKVPVKKTMAEDNCALGLQTMWHRVVKGMSDHLKPRTVSPDSEIPTKKPNLAINPHPKPRRKTCIVARVRGKGRGKSQLRKSGVSQSRHRKERTKQNIYSNIQDDLEAWEDSECYDSENENLLQGTRVNEEQQLSPCQETSKHCSMLFENFSFDETTKPRKRKQITKNEDVKGPLRVRYLPESAMEVDSRDSHDSVPRIGGFRPRLLSESSVDSEDSYCIVFESSSVSEYTDYDCDSVSDEESDDEESDDDDDDNDDDDDDGDGDVTSLRVRFNLEPQVHTMIKWNYAYRAARKGPWEEMARDRERFRGRIRCIERILEPILAPQHRKCIWQDRFDVDV